MTEENILEQKREENRRLQKEKVDKEVERALIDLAAISIMPELIKSDVFSHAQIAEHAYTLAEALIAERRKRNNEQI